MLPYEDFTTLAMLSSLLSNFSQIWFGSNKVRFDEFNLVLYIIHLLAYKHHNNNLKVHMYELMSKTFDW